jgi:hypothetical protein
MCLAVAVSPRSVENHHAVGYGRHAPPASQGSVPNKNDGVGDVCVVSNDSSTSLLEILCYNSSMAEWGFLTNHGRALLCIANDPGVRLRDIADQLGITERSAYAIVNDLAGAGYVVKEREGRRNRYIVQNHLPLPETTIRERTIGEVLDLLVGTNHVRRANHAAKVSSSLKKAARASRATKIAR